MQHDGHSMLATTHETTSTSERNCKEWNLRVRRITMGAFPIASSRPTIRDPDTT
jgi:hypothetical protein